MRYIDPRSLSQIVLCHVTYPNSPHRAETDVVARERIELRGTGSREKLFREYAERVLPLVDKSNSEYRNEVRTYLGMTQVLSRLIIREKNGNFWSVAHYS